jgi:hypothetical protein
MAPEMAVTVVDNASEDGTVKMAQAQRGVEIIRNPENRGFAGAANQAFRGSAEEVILLLNPDVVARTPLDAAVEACAKHGLSAGVLTDAEGRPQTGFTIRRIPAPAALVFELLGLNLLWPSNPVNRRYRYFDRDLGSGGPVEQPAGAFLMVRRDVWERLGGFDERFHPIWFEDVDFCKRALDGGYRIELVPEVRAEHLGGHSVNRIPAARRARLWYGSLLSYAAKHFRPAAYRVVCLSAILSAVPRMAAGMVIERSLTPITTYLGVFSLAVRRLVSSPKPAERPG